MDHAKKMEFVHKMTKLALEHVKQPVQHFDSGGTVQTQVQPTDNTKAPLTPTSNSNTYGTNQSWADPNNSWGGGIAESLGLASTYHAGSADIQAGTNQGQLNQAYTGVQGTLQNQNNLTQTLAPQAVAGTSQQQDLANQFSAESRGEGPNVAVNQLNQATGTNVANQAALMASQRGAAANPGLIARQASQQGAATQQEAAGQAATLQAQQQIAAQQNLAGLSANQINQAQSAVATEGQAQQNEQNILQGANTATNNANVGMQSNINTTNAQTASANASGIGGLIGAGASAIGSIFAAFAEGGEAEEQHPQKLAEGGKPQIAGNPLVAGGAPGAGSGGSSGSFVGNWLNSNTSSSGPNIGNGNFQVDNSGSKAMQQGADKLGEGLSSYYNTDNEIQGTPGEIPGAGPGAPAATSTAGGGDSLGGLGGLMGGASEMMAAKGGKIEKPLSAKGGKVKAKDSKQKAVVKGNSYSNDKIPALLSEKEIVLPREVTMAPDAPERAAAFVRQIQAKKGLRK